MQRSKRDRWKLLALIVLISTVAFCSAAYAQEQNEEMKSLRAEQKKEMKALRAEKIAERKAKRLERLDTDGNGDISKAEHKAGKKAKMIKIEMGLLAKKRGKYISRIEKKERKKTRKYEKHVKKL